MRPKCPGEFETGGLSYAARTERRQQACCNKLPDRDVTRAAQLYVSSLAATGPYTQAQGPIHAGLDYTVNRKNVPLNLSPHHRQILTDFENSFTGKLCEQFATSQCPKKITTPKTRRCTVHYLSTCEPFIKCSNIAPTEAQQRQTKRS